MAAQRLRRPQGSWEIATLNEERHRLHNAYADADLRINNDQLSSEEVLALTLTFLRARRIQHADDPLPLAPITGAPIK